MRYRTRLVVAISLVLAGSAAAQSAGPGAAFCKGDGTQGQCPCPGEVVFREEFDRGVLPDGWLATGLWSVTEACDAPCAPGPYAYFGDVATCTYGSIQQWDNRLVSPPMLLPDAAHIELTYCGFLDVEPEGDRVYVRVHGEQGSMLVFHLNWPPYEPQPHDLTPLAGQVVRIEFWFSADFFGGLSRSGWKVDDVLVRSTHNGFPGQGCLNSTLQGGRLDATGSASLSTGNLVVFVQELPPSTPVLFLASDVDQPPTPLWSGLSCLGGSPTVLAQKTSNLNGVATSKPFQSHGGLFQPGVPYVFQAWYRDSGALAPCGVERNLTNAYSILVQP